MFQHFCSHKNVENKKVGVSSTSQPDFLAFLSFIQPLYDIQQNVVTNVAISQQDIKTFYFLCANQATAIQINDNSDGQFSQVLHTSVECKQCPKWPFTFTKMCTIYIIITHTQYCTPQHKAPDLTHKYLKSC